MDSRSQLGEIEVLSSGNDPGVIWIFAVQTNEIAAVERQDRPAQFHRTPEDFRIRPL